jgi:DNA-binding GntR family transcriptional regulator
VERGHLDEAALAVLTTHVDAIEQAARRDDLQGMVHADIDFHRALSAYSGHELLMEHLDAIQVHSRRLLFYSDLYQPEPELVVRRHRELLRVLRSGDAYEVAIAVDEHISGPGRDIVDEMRVRENRLEASNGEDT